MNSRMDKYYKEKTLEDSRTIRNKEIYNKVSKEDFDKMSLTSNISIIDTDTTNLDIDKLKKLLDEKYSNPKNKRKDISEESEPIDDIEDTKEYDLKKVIEEAHKNKSTDYDRERFKKLRDTQFEILSSLNLNRDEDPIIEESLTVEEANLMNLIKTVNENALKREEIVKKESGLLDDLRGDDDTDILEPVDLNSNNNEFTDNFSTGKKPTILEELEKTKQLSKQELSEEIENSKVQVEEIRVEPVDDLEKTDESHESEINPIEEEENAFYTGKYKIKESDMDEFEELQKEMKSGGIIIKILISLLVLIAVAVGVYLLNKYMNLGLF